MPVISLKGRGVGNCVRVWVGLILDNCFRQVVGHNSDVLGCDVSTREYSRVILSPFLNWESDVAVGYIIMYDLLVVGTGDVLDAGCALDWKWNGTGTLDLHARIWFKYDCESLENRSNEMKNFLEISYYHIAEILIVA
eukprot:10614893-Ditylum_brightwellii.AAC.1